MVSSLEDHTDRSNPAALSRDFIKCPGPDCKTKIRGQHLCTLCMNKLPRALRERLEATLGQDPDDSSDLLVTTCLEELQNQRVEQVATRGRRKAR